MIIYKTTNLVNGKIYIGKDKNNNPRYLGSGKILCQAIEKYGRENFKKEIIEYCKSKEELNEKEIFWIKKLNAIEEGYNILKGGDGGAKEGRILSDETKRKISNSLRGHGVSDKTRKILSETHKGNQYAKGAVRTTETKEKLSNIQRGRKLSKETKEKMSNARKGKPNYKLRGIAAWNRGIKSSKETKEKMSNARKGKPNYKLRGREKSTEEREKISKSLTGKKQSKETIEKRKKSTGDPWNKGKTGVQTHSEITKKKMRESQKIAQKNQKIGKCIHCGVEMRLSHLNRYHNNNCKLK